jgi:hypothetical protein
MNEKCCNQNCNQGRDCPMRKKELTDEEIINLWGEDFFDIENEYNVYDFIEFARAILRKAQEK